MERENLSRLAPLLANSTPGYGFRHTVESSVHVLIYITVD